MGIEIRGDSFRAKFYQGRRLVKQQTFGTRAEAERFLTAERFKSQLSRDADLLESYFTPAMRAWGEASPHLLNLVKALGGEQVPIAEAGPRLEEFLRRYRNEVTPGKRGARQERIRIGQFLLEDFVRRPIETLRKQDFRDYQSSRLKQVAPATATRELNLLHAIIEHARDQWDLKLSENPASVPAPPGSDRQRDRRLEPGELEKLLSNADRQMRDTIKIALGTAMRRGELILFDATMLREINNADRAHIVLPKEITKTGRERAIPPMGDAVEVLRRLSRVRPRGPLLGYISGNALTMKWNRLMTRTGIKDLRFHDLRHESTSRFVASRLYSDAECMQITGHTTLRMFQRYLKPDGGELASRRNPSLKS